MFFFVHFFTAIPKNAKNCLPSAVYIYIVKNNIKPVKEQATAQNEPIIEGVYLGDMLTSPKQLRETFVSMGFKLNYTQAPPLANCAQSKHPTVVNIV